MTHVSEEIWASLEDLQPEHVAGYVVAQPAPNPEKYGGTGYILYGLFDTIEAAHGWGDTHIGEGYVVNVVWEP